MRGAAIAVAALAIALSHATRAGADGPPHGPLGAIDIDRAPRAGDDAYHRADAKAKDVVIHALPAITLPGGATCTPLAYVSSMTIDADGAGEAWKSDPDGQPGTSLSYASGEALDPTRIPYFVLPEGFEKTHPAVALGDVAAVVFEGRVAYAIWGDEGPREQVGEGSIALARALGIDPDPVRGGQDRGVAYVIFPGTRGAQPLAPEEIARVGRGCLRRAGGDPP
jgi:hypothetical protein